jgi:hypothetical protein
MSHARIRFGAGAFAGETRGCKNEASHFVRRAAGSRNPRVCLPRAATMCPGCRLKDGCASACGALAQCCGAPRACRDASRSFTCRCVPLRAAVQAAAPWRPGGNRRKWHIACIFGRRGIDDEPRRSWLCSIALDNGVPRSGFRTGLSGRRLRLRSRGRHVASGERATPISWRGNEAAHFGLDRLLRARHDAGSFIGKRRHGHLAP